jgi:hypothetical protein
VLAGLPTLFTVQCPATLDAAKSLLFAVQLVIEPLTLCVPPLMLLVERLLLAMKTFLFSVLSPAHHQPASALVVKPLQLGSSVSTLLSSLSCALLFYCYRIKITVISNYRSIRLATKVCQTKMGDLLYTRFVYFFLNEFSSLRINA